MVADDTELSRHALIILLDPVSPVRAEGQTELKVWRKEFAAYSAKRDGLLRRAFCLGTKEWNTHASTRRSDLPEVLRRARVLPDSHR